MKNLISIICFLILFFSTFFLYSETEASYPIDISENLSYRINIPLLFKNYNPIYQKPFSDYDTIVTLDGEIIAYTIDQYQDKWTYDTPSKTFKNYSEIILGGFVYKRISVIEKPQEDFYEPDYIRVYTGVTFIHCEHNNNDVCDATTFKLYVE